MLEFFWIGVEIERDGEGWVIVFMLDVDKEFVICFIRYIFINVIFIYCVYFKNFFFLFNYKIKKIFFKLKKIK